MKKKLAVAVSGAAVLVLALSSCTSDDADKFTADDWAKKYCDQAQPQLKKKTDAEQTIRQTAVDSKPAQIQAADSKAFQDLSDVNKALAAALRGAGTPPVDNGEKLVQDAAAELDANSKSYLDLKKQIDALDAKNQQKFADGLQPVATGLGKIEKNEAARKRLNQGDTGEAIAKQPGCKAPVVSSPPAA
ncbi:small secreted protein [Streptomyces sp. NPDC020681]|uniref:small secreted protein n=1 Tax=Streptomyces sp. NPDC020681 TaxID=3365083 RepID=UPI0037900423